MTIIGAGGGGGGKGGGGSGGGVNVKKDNLESRQVARIIDVLSEGEIEGFPSAAGYAVGSAQYNLLALKDIYFNNTPVVVKDANLTTINGAPGFDDNKYNFKDHLIESRNGTQSQSFIPISDSVQQEVEVNVKVTKNVPVTRTITDPNVNGVRVTVSIPQLQKFKDNGDVEGSQVRIKIRADYGAGYVDVIDDTISGRTADLYQRRYRIDLTQPPPVSIRVVRVTDDAPPSNQTTTINDIYWASYTELIYAKLAYPNTAHVGIQINAEQFSSIPTRSYRIRGIKVAIPSNATVDAATGRLIYSGVWNGNFQAAKWTSDPAWILWDLLTSKRYGFGDHINSQDLDKWAFFAASQYASELVPDGFGGQEPRFSCNVNIQTSEEAYKLINDMCSVFRAMPYWSVGTLALAQDRPTDPAYIFTQSNVTEEGFSYSGSSLKTRPTVAVVSYLDLQLRDIAYEVIEDKTGIDKYGVVKTEVSAFACTSRGQARRIGEWLLYAAQRETEVCSFTTNIAAGNIIRPGMVIRVADPVRAGRYRGGRCLENCTTTTIYIDRTASEIFYDGIPGGIDFNVILPDGTSESVSNATISGYQITLPTPLRMAPSTNAPFALGTSGLRPTLWRVLTVQEQDGHLYTITALSHDPSKYAYVERDVPLQPRDVTNLDQTPSTPGNLAGNEVLYESNGQVLSKLVISWQAVPSAARYELRYRLANGNWTTVATRAPDYEILNSSVGTYDIELVAVGSNFQRSTTATLQFNALGKTAPPADIPDLYIAPIDSQNAELYWPQSVDLDVRVGGQIEIRHSPQQQNATWSQAVQIVPAVSGSSTRKMVPLLEGTYMIRAVDSLGNISPNAAMVVVDLPSPQAALLVQEYREETTSPPFQGTYADTYYNAAELGVALASTGLIDSMALNGDWDALSDIDYLGGTVALGTYEFFQTLDLGGVYDLNLLRILKTRAFQPGDFIDYRLGDVDAWPDIDAANIGNVNAETQVRTTQTNPAASPTWSAWQPFVNGITRGRGFQFKVIATSSAADQNIVIEELGVRTELQRRTETQRGLVSGTSAFTLTYPNAFYATPSIGITAQDMSQGDYFTISNATRAGFSVTFRNSAGNIVSRTFDYQAVGHGREI